METEPGDGLKSTTTYLWVKAQAKRLYGGVFVFLLSEIAVKVLIFGGGGATKRGGVCGLVLLKNGGARGVLFVPRARNKRSKLLNGGGWAAGSTENHPF